MPFCAISPGRHAVRFSSKYRTIIQSLPFFSEQEDIFLLWVSNDSEKGK